MPFCLNCFEQTDSEPCRLCGYQPGLRRSALLLQQGILLREQYMIGRLLGNPGGFGITYLGYHRKLGNKVAIKEFLPRELAGRALDGYTVELHAEKDTSIFQAGLEQFLREAQLLAKFNHPNIVRVIDFFEENGTAYLVMEYYSGVTLVNYIENHGGRLGEQAALAILLPILDGLREVHSAGILHRDIKPQNIYITEQGRPILLDFGAARYTLEALSHGFTMLVTPGFAPIEQYDRQGKQGPWTDVYGCAATLFYLLSGNVPPDAIGRIAKDSFQPASELAASFELRRAVERGLALLPQNRPQTIEEFRELLINSYAELDSGQTQLVSRAPYVQPSDINLADLGQTADFQQQTAAMTHLETNIEPKAKTAQLAQHEPVAKRRWLDRQRIGWVVIAVLILAGVGILTYRNYFNPVKQLSQRGVDYSEQAFFQAVRNGDQAVVKLFLSAGYSVNQAEAATGATPLMAAIEAGQYPMAEYLLAKRPNLAAKDRLNRSTIDIALKRGDTALIKLIMETLKLAADSKDETGRSLVEKAIAFGNANSVQYLIERGANLALKDNNGRTPLDQALAANHQHIAQLLKAAGAKRDINQQFSGGMLNEIKLPPNDIASFEIDLLGNGIGQLVAVNRQNGRGNVLISQEGRALAGYNNLRGNWYVAFLRNDQVPDLVYLSLVGADFIEEIKIIGKTGQDTVGTLFSPDLGALRSMGLLRGQAGIRLEGRQIILNSGKNRAAVEWDEAQQVFRMRKI